MRTSHLGKWLRLVAMPIFLSPAFASPVHAQESPYAGPGAAFEQASAPLSEMMNLVAPVALYPDPLLSQVLVACTYSPELVEAQQWLRRYGYLQGTQLIQAAQQQNWDPSVQALVAFPGVLALLNSNIRWAADLGRLFLAEPADVMNAIQWLRVQAREKGQLANTPQFSIEEQAENGQSAIEIEPANPKVMYVPAYDPARCGVLQRRALTRSFPSRAAAASDRPSGRRSTLPACFQDSPDCWARVAGAGRSVGWPKPCSSTVHFSAISDFEA